MHGKRPAFLADMELLMFLAVTASLLGYCQTDEKGKTQHRDSRPLLLVSPLLPSILLPRVFRVSFWTAKAALKGIRISLSASLLGRARAEDEECENSDVREKERWRLTFIAAGMSSSREFTYNGSGLMVAIHTHRRMLLIVRETIVFAASLRARKHSPHERLYQEKRVQESEFSLVNP